MVPGNWISTCKTIKVDPSLTTYTKLITHVLKTYCKAYTIELWEEYVDVNLCDLGVDKHFLDMTPEAWWPKEKQMNWTLSKLKPLLHQRILSRGWKDSPQNGRKYCKLCDTATAAAKSLQSCPTLCDPINSSPPGSPVPGILQARTLEWVAISFSNAWNWSRSVVSDS